MRYIKKRAYAWSANIAYCVGLIASDGCLQKDGRHIDVTSADREQLVNFCGAFGREITISNKLSGSLFPAFRVQFSDVAFYDFLVEAGLTPAKSLTIGSVNIPHEYYADFLRGLFDGDGTTYGYMDKRWRSSFMFYVSFASASKPFLEYIQNTNTQLASTTPGSLKKSTRSYNLVYAKADSLKLASFMYYQSNLPALARKRDKLQGFIDTHKAAIIGSMREW